MMCILVGDEEDRAMLRCCDSTSSDNGDGLDFMVVNAPDRNMTVGRFCHDPEVSASNATISSPIHQRLGKSSIQKRDRVGDADINFTVYLPIDGELLIVGYWHHGRGWCL